MTISSSQNLKNIKCSFWLQKGVEISIRQNFPIRDPQIVGVFICYFCFMTTLSSQNLKNTKYSFWLQKGVKNWIPKDFLIRDPHIVGGFICYFCLMAILSNQNLKNTKYSFWLQKGVKKLIRKDFLIHYLQIVGGFICYFCLKIVFLRVVWISCFQALFGTFFLAWWSIFCHKILVNRFCHHASNFVLQLHISFLQMWPRVSCQVITCF